MRQLFYVFFFLEAGTPIDKPACLRFCTNTETTMLSAGTKTLSHCLLLEVDPPAWVMNPKCCDPRFRKVRWWGIWVRPLLRVVAATQHVSTHILHVLSLVRLLTPLLHHISQHQAVFFGGCWIGLIFEVLTIPYTWHIGFQFWPSFGLRLSYHRGKAKLYFSKFFKPKQIEFLGFKIISQSWNWTLGELFLSGLMLVQPPLSDRENKNILRRHLQSNSAQFVTFFLS